MPPRATRSPTVSSAPVKLKNFDQTGVLTKRGLKNFEKMFFKKPQKTLLKNFEKMFDHWRVRAAMDATMGHTLASRVICTRCTTLRII
jgi:16S rRNA A1518/A1519 N6-dimethyltransferase RsmA/KsgA/DIM1 with predicted DNA glycosylase/AP lyase activity